MDIKYTYTVQAVNQDSNHMEVLFQSEGLRSISVGMPLPKVGESLDDLVSMFVPYKQWIDDTTSFNVPAIGATGSKVISSKTDEDQIENDPVVNATTVNQAKSNKTGELFGWLKRALDTPFYHEGNMFKANQKTLNTLHSIKMNIESNVYTSVKFLLEDNTFVVLDASNIDAVIQQVGIRLQSVFDDLESKFEYIYSLNDIDAINNYDPHLMPSTVV